MYIQRNILDNDGASRETGQSVSWNATNLDELTHLVWCNFMFSSFVTAICVRTVLQY